MESYMSWQRVPMSKDTYQKLQNELDHLKKVARPAIIAEIAHARTQGDLKENAEFHAAKERQDQIEVNIIEIHQKSHSPQATLISPTTTVFIHSGLELCSTTPTNSCPITPWKFI